MPSRPLHRYGRRTRQALAVTAATAVAAAAVALTTHQASAAPLSLCNNSGSAPGPIQHVLVVMLENQSFSTVMNPAKAPYEAGTLAKQCGVASSMFGATHNSAANYLAIAGGQYVASQAQGCSTVASCSSTGDNLFAQADRAGVGWRNYVEAAGPTPTPCTKTTSIPNITKIGHEPGLFYGLADCPANVVPVNDLTAASGALWDALQSGSLPAFTWVTPSEVNDGEGPTHLLGADSWLKAFLARIQSSTTYQQGRTAVIVTYDEGGELPDQVVGEDCTDKAKDLAGQQESCHIPFFMVSPYTPAGTDATFFDHYSVTKTVEDIFGWPYVAHAGDAQTTSLVGHLGLPSTSTTGPPAPKQYVANPGVESDLTGWQGRYSDTSAVSRVQVPNGSHDGSWAMQITNSAAISHAAGVTNKGPLWVNGATTPTVKGVTYTASAWVNASSATKVNLRLQECNTKGAACINPRVAVVQVPASTWTQISVQINASTSGASITFALYGSLPAHASFLADTFSLTSPGG